MNDVGTQVFPVRSDIQVQFIAATRTIGTIIHSLMWAYCSRINSHAGVQTPCIYIKDNLVQCWLTLFE